MGSCCSNAHDVDKTGNMHRQTVADVEPSESKEYVQPIKFDSQTIIEHIFRSNSTAVINAWSFADKNSTYELDLATGLPLIFLYFTQSYVQHKRGNSYYSRNIAVQDKCKRVANELSDYYCSIMIKYEPNSTDKTVLTNDEYLECFISYLQEPTPAPSERLTNSETTVETKVEEKVEIKEEKEVEYDRQVTEPIKKLPVLEETFDMLKYISTSPTIIDNPSFSADTSVELLRNALEDQMARIKREQLCGEILCRLTEVQRVLVRKTYVGTNDVLLLDAFDDHFSNKTLGILTTLCQSRAENDAICIQRCISKINTDYVTVDQILMSSTNLHLEAICRAYESKFDGLLLDRVKDSIGKRNGTYHHLLTAVVNCVRTECHPRDISRSNARKDAKILYQMLEKQKTVDKLKVIQIFTHQPWLHINEICKYYTQISHFDIRTRIEKQFGARSFHALSVIIDYSRSRHAFYAQILQKSMKGLGGTSDDMLIRVVVGRSGIDLAQICKVFTKKYADGKTLLQWLRGSTSGTFCKMLCKLTNIGDEYISDIPLDDEELYSITSDNKEEFLMSSMRAGIYSSAMDNISWDEYICTSPTIKYNSHVEIPALANELIAVLMDPKLKKDAKQTLINVIAIINCSQRKELSLAFKELHPQRLDLKECMEQSLKKGKTKSAIFGLMQDPIEFYAFALKQAIRTKKVEVIFEIICQCSNAEASELKNAYSVMTDDDNLVNDIEQLFIKNTTAKMMINKILNGERNENIGVDRKLMRENVEELSKKKLTSSKEKGYLAELLVKHSFTHLDELIHKFNETSEISFPAVCKVVIGTGFSGQIADNIIKLATNRYGYFAQKLREAMKKISTDDLALMRILIGRCEKDLGEIVHEFSEQSEYGEGKTLKQWIKDSTSGSFQSTLLRISGLHDDNMIDSGYSDSDGSAPNSPLAIPKQDEVELKMISINASATTDTSTNNGNLLTPLLDYTADAVGNVSGSDDGNGAEIDENMHNIQLDELADFMSTKMNIKSVTRLWKHLKITDMESMVETSEVINILLFSCVLFCAWKSSQRKGGIKGIDKKKLKSILRPVVDWIIEERMNTAAVRRDEFVRFGQWVKEYAELQDSQT